MQPLKTPLGLLLGQTAKAVSRAFDEALVAAGGSLPIWLIVMALKREPQLTHGELADRVGITGATLTHHLNALEAQGFIRRERLADNRRVQFARLTDAGEQLFHRLRQVAQGHDRRLRQGLSGADEETLRTLLAGLAANVSAVGPESDASRKEQSHGG